MLLMHISHALHFALAYSSFRSLPELLWGGGEGGRGRGETISRWQADMCEKGIKTTKSKTKLSNKSPALGDRRFQIMWVNAQGRQQQKYAGPLTFLEAAQGGRPDKRDAVRRSCMELRML